MGLNHSSRRAIGLSKVGRLQHDRNPNLNDTKFVCLVTVTAQGARGDQHDFKGSLIA